MKFLIFFRTSKTKTQTIEIETKTIIAQYEPYKFLMFIVNTNGF